MTEDNQSADLNQFVSTPPFAEFVRQQVQSGELSRDDDVTVNVGALVDSHAQIDGLKDAFYEMQRERDEVVRQKQQAELQLELSQLHSAMLSAENNEEWTIVHQDDVVTEPDLPRHRKGYIGTYVDCLEKELDDERRMLKRLEKELFEVGIQMQNAKAHNEFLIRVIDEIRLTATQAYPTTIGPKVLALCDKAATYGQPEKEV